MREDISKRINEVLEEPLQTPTKQEAYDRLMACGIITEEGTIAPAYKDILQPVGVRASCELKYNDSLPIEWGIVDVKVAHLMVGVRLTWRLIFSLNFPDLNKTIEHKKNRYEEYAQNGKEAVRKHFDLFDHVGGCGYQKATQYALQCWWDKFELEYLIEDLKIDISKESPQRKKNLDEVLAGYTGQHHSKNEENENV